MCSMLSEFDSRHLKFEEVFRRNCCPLNTLSLYVTEHFQQYNVSEEPEVSLNVFTSSR
jgi:hypothetical protein